ncbi:MAG: phosphate acyltransferase PlsX [Phycisphaeraceae bacterium]
MRIAIDVMGGDHAPDAMIDGAVASLPLLGDNDALVLVGDRKVIEESLTEHGVAGEPRLQIEATTQVIAMNEPPTAALRTKTDSSISRWAYLGSRKAPAERHADVIISAGNTGACVAAAQMAMRRLPGVHRPGIAVTIPTFHGPIVLCDVGANIVPKPPHLFQYGHMAALYAKMVHGIDNPRVALLSVGAEEGKGTGIIREAGKMLRNDDQLNYVGQIEGRDLFDNRCDVCVTEGFTGNVVLKLAEGLAAGLFKTIAHEIFEQDAELAMKFEPVVKTIYRKHDYHEYGGAPLLGANGTCLICHGSSEARTIKSAVGNAIKYVNLGVNDAIVQTLAATTADQVEA